MDSARLPYKCSAMNLVPVHKRYVFGFGMIQWDVEPQIDRQNLMQLDTWNLKQGWQIIAIKCELAQVGCQYGFLPL